MSTGWKLILAGLIFALGFGSAWKYQDQKFTAELSKKDLAHAALVQKSLDFAIKAQALASEESIRRVEDIAKVEQDAHRQSTSLSADVQLANDTARRLQSSLDIALGTIRNRSTCNTSATVSSTTTGDPIGVLGRLYSESDKAEGELAEFADKSRIAGLTCERSYDALRAVKR